MSMRDTAFFFFLFFFFTMYTMACKFVMYVSSLQIKHFPQPSCLYSVVLKCFLACPHPTMRKQLIKKTSRLTFWVFLPSDKQLYWLNSSVSIKHTHNDKMLIFNMYGVCHVNQLQQSIDLMMDVDQVSIKL